MPAITAISIVVKETQMRFLDRLDEFYDDAREAMDILVYTPQEFEEMKERPFVKRALREGKMLYGAASPQSPSRGG
jgi:hypothetical protein